MSDLTRHTLARSYLLRIWEERDEPAAEASYRFSLVDPHTHQRYSFESLTHLVAFLEDGLRDQGGGQAPRQSP